MAVRPTADPGCGRVWDSGDAGNYHRGMTEARREDIALLALLRLRPDGMSWEKIANEVQLEGSAITVLDGVGESDGALLADPEP